MSEESGAGAEAGKGRLETVYRAEEDEAVVPSVERIVRNAVAERKVGKTGADQQARLRRSSARRERIVVLDPPVTLHVQSKIGVTPCSGDRAHISSVDVERLCLLELLNIVASLPSSAVEVTLPTHTRPISSRPTLHPTPSLLILVGVLGVLAVLAVPIGLAVRLPPADGPRRALDLLELSVGEVGISSSFLDLERGVGKLFIAFLDEIDELAASCVVEVGEKAAKERDSQSLGSRKEEGERRTHSNPNS